VQIVFKGVDTVQVTVLEAQGHVGGRVYDDTSLGPCVPLGAMIVTGICSNPITVLCKQVRNIFLYDKCMWCVCMCIEACVYHS